MNNNELPISELHCIALLLLLFLLGSELSNSVILNSFLKIYLGCYSLNKKSALIRSFNNHKKCFTKRDPFRFHYLPSSTSNTVTYILFPYVNSMTSSNLELFYLAKYYVAIWLVPYSLLLSHCQAEVICNSIAISSRIEDAIEEKGSHLFTFAKLFLPLQCLLLSYYHHFFQHW